MTGRFKCILGVLFLRAFSVLVYGFRDGIGEDSIISLSIEDSHIVIDRKAVAIGRNFKENRTVVKEEAHERVLPSPTASLVLEYLPVENHTASLLSEGWWIQSGSPGKHNGQSVFVGSPPVHESIMYLALQGANSNIQVDKKYLRMGPDLDAPPPSLNDFIRGSVWNDDPLSLLFKAGKPWKKRTGTVFANRMEGLISTTFSQCRGGMENWQKSVKWPNHIMCHSHYGNLQFLHGMGNADGDQPSGTREKIMAYAEWSYKMALGDRKLVFSESGAINPTDQRLVDSFGVLGTGARLTLHQSFKQAIPEEHLNRLTVKQLYTNEDGEVTSIFRRAGEVAIGSLVHLLADSYAVGHTGRETGVDELGPIFQFRGYVEQDHRLHSDYDMFPWLNVEGDTSRDAGKRQMLGKRLGFDTAIKHATSLLSYYFRETEWDAGPQQLLEEVFRLSSQVVPAGSGQITYEFSGTKVSKCQICFYSSTEYSDTPQCIKLKEPCKGSYTEADFGCVDGKARLFAYTKSVEVKGQLQVRYNSQICNGGRWAIQTFTI